MLMLVLCKVAAEVPAANGKVLAFCAPLLLTSESRH